MLLQVYNKRTAWCLHNVCEVVLRRKAMTGATVQVTPILTSDRLMVAWWSHAALRRRTALWV